MAEHAGTSTAETLKKFAQKVTDSSTKERISILEDVASCVARPDFPENAFKGVFKFLTQTIGKYQDGASRRAVFGVVKSAAKTHPNATLKNVVTCLTTQAECHKKCTATCRSSSGDALFALTWTCIVLREVFPTAKKDELKSLVALQCGLVYGALAAGYASINKSVFKKLVSVFKCTETTADDYGQMLQDIEPSICNLTCIGQLMCYLHKTKQQQLIDKFKGPFLEIYMKQVLGSRTKPLGHLLTNCKDLLRHCSHSDFKDQVLPAAQKAMLRNPEIILQSIGNLLSHLTLDLSQYVQDLAKPLGAQLCSKDPLTRDEAAAAFQNLSEQCSDPEAVEKLLTHLFGVLNGSEGKLTVADQRISVLQAIGNVCHNTVSGANNLQNLSTSVSEKFIPLLQQEVHEGTLVHALLMLSLWCTKFYTSVPDKLIQWFKKGIGLKTSTSAVRNAYIKCMDSAFNGDTLPQAVDMLPVLIQTIEKANNQASQSQLVTEAVSAACILVKISLVDIQAESKLGPFWNTVLDTQKQLFVNDKFLTSVGDEVLMSVVTLSEKLILEYPQKMTENVSKPYYKAIVYSLTRKSYSLRKRTKTSVRRLLSLLGGTSISLSLLSEFNDLIKTQKFIDPELLQGEDDKENIPEQSKYIMPHLLSQALLALTFVEKADPKDAEAIAKATLIPAHHPCIVYANESTWTDILAQLNLDARNFVKNNCDSCIEIAKTNDEFSESVNNALSTLVWIAPDVVLPPLIEYVHGLLDNPEMCNITRDEYGIFLTADGELYDKSLLESFTKSAVSKESNIKRENKLYSYAEQMADLELKKEFDKKKGKAKEAPKLSKKQEEMLQAQIQKESETRQKLSVLNQQLCCGCQILKAAVKGNKEAACGYMKQICGYLYPLLKSPLGAPVASQVFIKYGQAAFEDKFLGDLVSNVTLRLINPECKVNSEWTHQSQSDQGSRIIQNLYNLSVPDISNPNKDSVLFPSSTFAFIYYLIRAILHNGGLIVDKNEGTLVKALKLIAAHAQTRKGDEDDSELYDPNLLPHEELLQQLIQVISTSATKLQQLASVTLVEVCKSINGDEGCAKASDKEIKVLLNGLRSPCTTTRDATLQGLLAMVNMLPNIDDNFEIGLEIALRVWSASFDDDENVQSLAEKLKEELGLDEPCEDMCSLLIEDIIHDEEIVRRAAAKTLKETLQCHKEYITPTIQQLFEKYEEKLYMPPPVLDGFGRLVEEQPLDQWEARSGVALALEKISSLLPSEQINEVFSFFVPKSLGDRHVEVRTHMRLAALAAVNEHGKEHVSELLPVFEDFLANAPDTASYDAVRQSIVILMGSLAKHLDKDNPKVKPIVAQLIGALSTPSQEVQESVANCLPPLVPAIKQDAPELVQKLLQLLLESDNYGERKGAAYGLAGLVRGLGITALKQLEIMSTLERAVKDKKNPRKREGALFAYEMLCIMLGKLFEPYVVQILPHLLLCFGDGSQYVREAADETSKAVMSMLTAHGVKLVLPSLLKGLEEDAWRTKTGAVELLGAMAFCAPKQLSACLPSIVPKLTEVLTDSHVKVQKSGAQALKQIGSVIRNPEIQAIVPVLLDALQEPSKKTMFCLQTLLETKFVHFIDAPSLALIMPVVERAFQERVTETRKMAAQIIGNMYSLTDQKDLDPYIEKVIPGLKQSLLDPVPEVRTVSAKALGAMVRGIGGEKFEDLMKWLMDTLKSESSSVDRSGAAQGLSEVIGGLGIQELKRLMPNIIQTAERNDIPPHVRDGYTMMYIYLPSVFGDDFMEYIGPIIPSILKALADESEYVRDTALKAGQRIINVYADTAIELLLPQLENGLFDDNWRIRYSSVQLLGDLLYKLSGVTGKMSTETAHDDDNFGTESSQKIIMRALGKDRRDRVLSGLYMGRSDTALLVRQSALHVWKIIVAHTPQTLREILPTLFKLLLSCLASTSYDKRQVAARTLGDLVRKLGDRVLPEIIPILESGLDSEQADQRQGVCIGLSEIMAATSRDHVLVFSDSLIPTVRRALVDPLPEVREAAARTFDNLHANISQRALDEILPDLLQKLGDPEYSERALDGLQQVMTVKSRVVLPYLVPQLTSRPVNTRALSFLSSVAGDALTRHLTKILPALMSSLSEKSGTPEEEQELAYCRSVVLSVSDPEGVRTIMEELLSAANTPSGDICSSAVTILHAFCEGTSADYSDYLPQLFRGLIGLFVRSDEKVLHASWNCLNAVTKKLDVSEMLQHIADVKLAMRYATSDFKGKELPGFSLPKKGIAPILPIFREGVLSGSQDVKEQAAIGLGELINLTSPEGLKSSVVAITGPLIRILGDRFTWNVKVAVLETLTILLGKVGALLKPFLPQLQTTFLKALNDPQRSVRLKAASALGKLIVIHTRVDPLFTELHNGIKNASDTSVRDTMLQALRLCLSGAGKKMSDALRKQIMTTLQGMLGIQEDTTRLVSSGCLGSLCSSMSEEELADTLIQHLLDNDTSVDWMLRQGRSIALYVALKESPDTVWKPSFHQSIINVTTTLTGSDRIPLCLCGFRSLGYLLKHQIAIDEIDTNLVSLLVKGMKVDSNDVKQLVTQVIAYLANTSPKELPAACIKILVPPLVMGTKEKNTIVKSNSEFALVAVLKLREGDAVLTATLSQLDVGMKESLNEVVTKSLNKICKQPESVQEEIDDTVLK